MQDGQAFPWHPSRGNQGIDYMQDGQVFPWHPSQGNQATDYSRTDKLSLAPLLGKPGDRLHAGQTSLPLAPLSGKPGDRLQSYRTDKLSLAPLSGKPGDRLQSCRTDKPSPGTCSTPKTACFYLQWQASLSHVLICSLRTDQLEYTAPEILFTCPP